MDVWRNEFKLTYTNWDKHSDIEVEIIRGSYRDALKRARQLVIKETSPNRGQRRAIEISQGSCFLKEVG